MPTTFEVGGYPPQSLMQFSFEFARDGTARTTRWRPISGSALRGLQRSIARDESMYFGEEAAYAFHTILLPIQIAIWRCREERVHTCTVSTVAADHIVGRDHVAFALRHLRAVLDHHALR